MVCSGIVRTGTIYDCHDTQRFLGPGIMHGKLLCWQRIFQRKVLDSAVNGIYSAEQIHTLPVWWRNQLFVPLPDGMYQVKKELRQQVVSDSLILMNHAPFKKKMHVIF